MQLNLLRYNLLSDCWPHRGNILHLAMHVCSIQMFVFILNRYHVRQRFKSDYFFCTIIITWEYGRRILVATAKQYILLLSWYELSHGNGSGKISQSAVVVLITGSPKDQSLVTLHSFLAPHSHIQYTYVHTNFFIYKISDTNVLILNDG